MSNIRQWCGGYFKPDHLSNILAKKKDPFYHRNIADTIIMMNNANMHTVLYSVLFEQ